MIWDTSIWRLGCSNRSKIRSAQKCYLCLRYVVSPMCPGRTSKRLVGANGFEPSTSWSRISSRNTILLARLALFCVEHADMDPHSAAIGLKSTLALGVVSFRLCLYTCELKPHQACGGLLKDLSRWTSLCADDAG